MGDPYYESFCAFVAEHRLVGPGDHVLVALSGGADSVALLRLVLAYRDRESRALRVSACHLDHGIRAAGARDAVFCRELCAALDVPFSEDSADVPGYVASRGVGTEEAARTLRYRFFETAARRIGASVVATAHHADDNAETVLMRVARGTGVRGLGGIPPSRPLAGEGEARLIRPLLNQRAEALRDRLRSLDQPWREDATNRDTRHTRNHARHVLLPALSESLGTDAVVLLNRLAGAARGLDAFARRSVARHLDNAALDIREDGVAFDVAWFSTVPAPLRGEALCEVLRGAGAPMGEMTEAHIDALSALAGEPKGADALSLPGVHVQRSAGRVKLTLAAAGPCDPEALGGRLTAEPVTGVAAKAYADSPSIELVDADALSPPLTARTWRKGDRFVPLGASGSRKLQDVFTDADVPSFDSGPGSQFLARAG